MIDDNPELPWNWNMVSDNANMTLEYVLKHFEKLNFFIISCSIFKN